MANMEAKGVSNSDGSQKKEIRTRQRASHSCTECRRRKQKCNQTKGKPCNNCARRFPPVPCTYESFRSSNYKESMIDLTVTSSKFEESGSESSEYISSSCKFDSPLQQTYHNQLQTLQNLEHLPPRPNWIVPVGVHAVSLTSVPPDGNGSQRDDTSITDATALIRTGQYHQHPEYDRITLFGMEEILAGGLALQPLQTLPIESTKRNTELFQFFTQRLSPYMSSIDGNNAPVAFTSQWLPFMTQSPITVHVTILTASYFEASFRKIDVEKSVDAMSAKVTLIKLINEHIASHRRGVSDESIAAVMSLAYNELIYADRASTLAHMRGLRDMVQTRGGINSITFDLLRKMLLRTDYQVASTYECDMFLDAYDRNNPVPILESYPPELNNPLLDSNIRFVDVIQVRNLSFETARLLDDVRLLTTFIIDLTGIKPISRTREEMLAAIHWIHDRLISSPSTNPNLANDFLYQTCRTTAIIYSSAILTQTPLSLSCTPQLFQQLWLSIWRVPLQFWKQIPGIFLWVLLVVNPYARDKPEGRILKALTPATTMAAGIVDWEAVMATLKGFVAVQRWLSGGLRDMVLPARGSVPLRTLENGMSA